MSHDWRDIPGRTAETDHGPTPKKAEQPGPRVYCARCQAATDELKREGRESAYRCTNCQAQWSAFGVPAAP